MAHLLGRSGSSGEVLLLHPGQILVVARVGNAERGPLVVVVVQGRHWQSWLGKTSTKNMWLKYEFFPKASDPPPLTFGIFEALFSLFSKII